MQEYHSYFITFMIICSEAIIIIIIERSTTREYYILSPRILNNYKYSWWYSLSLLEILRNKIKNY